MNLWGNNVPVGERVSIKSRGRNKLEAWEVLEEARRPGWMDRVSEGRGIADEA